MRRLRPTQAVNSILDVDLPHLLSLGKRVLIFDLDNTLCRRGAKTLNPQILQYLKAAKETGFQVGILTNRRRNANDPIIHDLRVLLPVVCAAGKPGRSSYVKLLNEMGASSDDAVMIGDKRWTDIWGANRVGIYSIRVKTYAPLN